MNKKLSALLLKIIILFLAVLSLFLLFVVIPQEGTYIAKYNTEVSSLYLPSYIFVLFSSLPFFIVLYLSYQLVSNIGKNIIFTNINSKFLKYINKLAVIEMIIFIIPLVLLSTMRILSPGVFFLFIIVELIALTIAGITYVFKVIIDQAVTLTKENDLII